jgi:hypothetical protein
VRYLRILPKLKFYFFKLFSEDGEEIDQLPYVRLSRRIHPHIDNHYKNNDIAHTAAVKEISPDRLLATKRIITAFNSGDVELLRDIIYEATVDSCEVYFSSLKHVFIGKSALFSLWISLFEAFPNGIFRTSDSVINEKKQVFTSFLFFGTKIFPLLIDGMPLELLSSHSLPSVAMAAAASSSSTVNTSDSITSGGVPSASSSSTSSSSSAPSSQYIVQSASVVADRNRPLYTTSELLEMDRVPEMIFEGRIVLHMNEYCKIKRFDFAWTRKV